MGRIRIIVHDDQGDLVSSEDYTYDKRLSWKRELLRRLQGGDDLVLALLRNRRQVGSRLIEMLQVYRDLWAFLSRPTYQGLREFRDYVQEIGIPDGADAVAEYSILHEENFPYTEDDIIGPGVGEGWSKRTVREDLVDFAGDGALE